MVGFQSEFFLEDVFNLKFPSSLSLLNHVPGFLTSSFLSAVSLQMQWTGVIRADASGREPATSAFAD